MAKAKKEFLQGAIATAAVHKKSREEIIKESIVILPELQGLIPPLTTEEFGQLTLNIRTEGCREPLMLWQQDDDSHVLIDGHNRYRICTEHHIDFNVTTRHFDSIDEVKDWMIANQLGKRNMTEEQKAYFRGLQYQREKKQGERTDLTSGQDVLKLGTQERLAEQHKVSAKTIQRDAKYAEGLNKFAGNDSDLKWKILNRVISVPKSILESFADSEETELLPYRKQLQEKGYITLPMKQTDSVAKYSTPEEIKATGAIERFEKEVLALFAELKANPNKATVYKLQNLVGGMEKELWKRKK
jgi:hypothetical protein